MMRMRTWMPMVHAASNEAQTVNRICCIGAGRLGVFSMLVMAHHWPQLQFHIVDKNEELIHQWNSQPLPFHESGLLERIMAPRNLNVFFELDIGNQIQQAEVIFIAVDVPTKVKGEGKKFRLDVTEWEKLIRKIGPSFGNGYKTIVEKSTVPLESSEKITKILNLYVNPGSFAVVSNPKFFSQGTAFHDLEHPDRVVMSSETDAARTMLRGLYERWVPLERLEVLDDDRSVELSKVASNAILAINATCMQAVTLLSERIGADVSNVSNIIRGDGRMSGFLQPSIGFGGRGLNKDVAYLAYLADFNKLQDYGKFFRLVLSLNQKCKDIFVDTISTRMSTIREKVFAIYGFSYKRDTDDIRDSASLYICQRLLDEGAVLRIFDPRVPRERIQSCFPQSANLVVTYDMGTAWQGADAACFLVNWPEFNEKVGQSLNQMWNQMKKPDAYFIDGCNGDYPYELLRDAGFTVIVPGRPRLSLPLP